jgi:hypothetical protein
MRIVNPLGQPASAAKLGFGFALVSRHRLQAELRLHHRDTEGTENGKDYVGVLFTPSFPP